MPDVPDLKDIRKIQINRDEKILKEIIKQKDELITELYQNNILLHQELSKQSKIIDKAEKYQIERDSIIANNKDLNKKVNDLELEFKIKENDIRYEYQSEIRKLEKENNRLNKIIDKFYFTVEKFIDWICHKFGIGESEYLVRDFQKETNTFIDPEKQIQKEEYEKNWDLEL